MNRRLITQEWQFSQHNQETAQIPIETNFIFLMIMAILSRTPSIIITALLFQGYPVCCMIFSTILLKVTINASHWDQHATAYRNQTKTGLCFSSLAYAFQSRSAERAGLAF